MTAEDTSQKRPKTKAERKSFEQLHSLPVKKQALQPRKAAEKHPNYELTTVASLKFVKDKDKDASTDLPSPAKKMPKRPCIEEPLPKSKKGPKEVKFGGVIFTMSIGRGYFSCQYCGIRHSAKNATKDAEEWLICSLCRRAQHALCVKIENRCFCQSKKGKDKRTR